MSGLSGKVQTVLGLVDPDQLGRTMTHEHLTNKDATRGYDFAYIPPAPADKEIAAAAEENQFQVQHMHWLHQNPYSCCRNMNLRMDLSAVQEELVVFKKVGGGTIVENTTTGLRRDVVTLKQLSKDTGVHIVAGAGFYVDCVQTEATKKMSVEQLTDIIVSEVLHGADGTDVRCGVIGEIGTSWPITEFEKKVLKASAQAQAQLGCPVIIHPGRDAAVPTEVIRILQEAGGDISKTVMSHLDRTFYDKEELLEFANLGCYLEYDLFGNEMLNYHFNLEVDMPSDSQRVQTLAFLVKEGFEDRLLVSHDVHTRHRLTVNGGHGYSHILKNIVPKMLTRGISQQQVDKILIHNPKRWLTFK